jgi:hypothetical protein
MMEKVQVLFLMMLIILKLKLVVVYDKMLWVLFHLEKYYLLQLEFQVNTKL